MRHPNSDGRVSSHPRRRERSDGAKSRMRLAQRSTSRSGRRAATNGRRKTRRQCELVDSGALPVGGKMLADGCCAASSPRHRSLPSKLQKRPTGTKAVPLGLAEDRTAFGRFQDSANRKKGINRQFITCYEIGRRLENFRRDAN